MWLCGIGRLRSCDKTPDALLKVPVGIVDRDGATRVVTWIDSKAMFGDALDSLATGTAAAASGVPGPARTQDIVDQAVSYTNRFGPGVILYWFNFVERLEIPDVYISSGFPPCTFVSGDEDAVTALVPDFLGDSDELCAVY